MSTHTRFDHAFSDAPKLPLTKHSRYVLFSDCHRGVGTSGDNFLKNQHLYFAALQYYFQEKYTYLELGDGDELWENRSFARIKEIHNNTFWLLSRFYQEQRLYMLYGNHDMVKRSFHFTNCQCATYPCSTCREEMLFPRMVFHEGIILENKEEGPDLYLTHGHQASFLNSVLWRLARFLVRYVWKPMEHFGFLDPTSAARNNTMKNHTERISESWAKEHGVFLITGHTHRPMMGSPDSPYFNTGSCVHPRCITCIEIKNLSLTLVKWSISTCTDGTLKVKRTPLASAENVL